MEKWSQPRGQARGPWLRCLPLPLPVWAHDDSPALTVPTVEQYEELAGSVELETQHLLREHRYDTVGNFLRLYREFKASNDEYLDRFHRKYQPIITDEHHTCVGLGFVLLRRLCGFENKYPGIASSLYLVSCEETIFNIAKYVGGPPDVDSGEKEHVLVCLKIEINGRKGVLLLDPGYHVARVITVMADKMYPHTGWFTQSEEPGLKKEYNYFMCAHDSEYVEWHERETRSDDGKERNQTALIYVARPYLTAIDVTERRNLSYNFRSLLARDTKGHVTAGLYFRVVLDRNFEQTFTLFYQTSNGKKRVKMPFNKFCSSPKTSLDAEESTIITECARQIGLTSAKLENMLSSLATIMSDTDFLASLLTINARINNMAADN